MSDIRVCGRCGEPLVSTFEFSGAEFVCLCGNTEGIFGQRASTSPALVARLAELTELYGRDRAEREGREYSPLPRVGDPGVEAPTCGGCSAQPPPGTPLDGGKPTAWFSRTREGATEYACSRACVPEREAVMPW